MTPRADASAEPGHDRPVRDAVAALWDRVSTGDEHAAVQVVRSAVAAGVDREVVLLDVVGAVQARVGAEWAANRLTVAQEHAATAINDRIVTVLTSEGDRPRGGTRIAVACVDGEWHALPARLLAEVLKLRGFAVDYLGAQVPTPHLVAHLHRTGPDLVALSASLATRLPGAHAAITACQAAGVPVLAGGAAFGADGRYARLLGADLWAPDARTAADLLADRPPRHPRPAGQPVDDLPHLEDQEYTLVVRSTPRLVEAVYGRLEQRFPAMRHYTDSQRGHTADDLTHIVEFLATTLYTDDDALFGGFVVWTAGILAARGVPAVFLPPALDFLVAELHDFPRATRILEHARARLTGAPPDHREGRPTAP